MNGLKIISGYTAEDRITSRIKENYEHQIDLFIKEGDNVTSSTYLKYFKES